MFKFAHEIITCMISRDDLELVPWKSRSYQCPHDSSRNLPESGHSGGIKFGRKAC